MGAATPIAYVRSRPAERRRPPVSARGPFAWLRQNLFSTPFNAVLTIVAMMALAWLVPPVIRFLLIDAVWVGADREACLAGPDGREVGACWPFVRERIFYFIYGSYPLGERWRVDLFFALFAFGAGWLLWLEAPRRTLGAAYFFVVLPIASFILLSGWPAVGLARVDTALWGGLLVTVVVAAVGIVLSLPLGIVLALGRRSKMPIVKFFSVAFIEFVRGVPLITVLFMASVMLPLFVPPAWSPDKLMRALVGVTVFSAAYMAEVVRAGLAAIPRGQFEAAQALGLSYGRMMRLIVLPQALRITIPNIVNSTVALFKDTTLVFFVGIFDFLRTIEVARADPKWATPVTSATGYAFAALFYFVCCWSMSLYARRLERRLSAGQGR
ncbi:amino acid ABC transporter permease [Xanthobacteraceae bacterium Astr-EGSB]|uniref:amino acid ABC transporter permease n=1 Tax=Astrobacterium formosum TaxID=3069710 RepID=UPI0027B11125|nr:amino acid ABC transporter permease [Xanthobacteraceae bacterium Astr-EGSB]